MNIPRRVTLLAHTITVDVVPKTKWKHEDAVAYFDPATYSIKLMRQKKGQLLHAYLHEITHAILYVMGHKLYSDEQFVDLLAGLLQQALETAE